MKVLKAKITKTPSAKPYISKTTFGTFGMLGYSGIRVLSGIRVHSGSRVNPGVGRVKFKSDQKPRSGKKPRSGTGIRGSGSVGSGKCYDPSLVVVEQVDRQFFADLIA